MRQLLQKLLSYFFLLNIVRRFKSRSSLMKIKAAQVYILGVKKTRLFFLGALFVSVSFVFLTNGLSLVQAAFFTYSMWSTEVKFFVALLLGLIELLGAIGIFICLFREETWVKFYGIHEVINSVVKGKSDNKNEKDQN
jgi:hypothetical protein